MSYWILPESVIPVSATTVQQVTNLERQTDEFKTQVETFEKNLEGKYSSVSADVASKLRDVPTANILSYADEDNASKEEHNRIISNEDVKEARINGR